MANIRIAEGDHTVDCAACMKKVKSVYVFNGKCSDGSGDFKQESKSVTFEFPLCLEYLVKAGRMLSAIEGVGVVTPHLQFLLGVRAAPFGQHTEMPAVVMTPGANQFHNMMSDAEGDGFEYSVPEWAKDIIINF